MNLIDCDVSRAPEILAIFNDAILTSTALYDYKPRTMAMMQSWFEAKIRGNLPVIAAVAPSGELMGFGTYGPFRPHPAYKYTVEHSVYVARAYRGQGLGRGLLEAVISRARAQDFHSLIGVIDSQNIVSIKLHESLGFESAGQLRQTGFKFGRWLDIVFYQLILETPVQPTEG